MTPVEYLIQLGFTKHQEGKLEDAELTYLEALKMDTGNAEVYNLLGVLKLQENDVISAINWIEKAIEIEPAEYFYETLFQAYIRAKLYKPMVKRADEVLKLYPKNFSLLFNLALSYKNLKQNKEAIKFYDKALKIDPASYDAWFNISHLYSIEAETHNALSALEICKKIRPHDKDTEYFLSLALMRVKDYNNGLKYFENRLCRETAIGLQNKTYPNKAREDNVWDGKDIKDKTLYVYYEAGFGDTIMFSRYLPLAAKKCKKLIFKCQKPLAPLFRENGLGIDEVIDSFVPEGSIDFDYHIPLLSLPHALKLKDNKVFAYSEGYLGAKKDRIEEYRQKYFMNDKIKVGIKWQGNTYYDIDRVIPTKSFIPLMEVENTQYYSFQTFEGKEDIDVLKGIIDIGKDLIDFSQTASALANLDLVICNDTSLAHLAGAMGIPCWVLLPYEVNWRWHTDLSVCDWYDSVKLFRQHKSGDWEGVFADILEEMHD